MWCKHQLGELAKNQARFAERGVQLVGVSQDEAADSRAFAETYDITFPLLTDREREVSRAYTGIDGADNTIPGVVLIRRDGTIAFRQIAQEKDDRLDSAQLLAIIDRTLGRSGGSAAHGYTALERLQLGVEGGVSVEDEVAASAHVRVALPIGRYAYAGVWGGTSLPRTGVDGGALAGVRLPFLADTAAVQLTALGGVAAFGDLDEPELVAGGRLGLWVALSPRWAMYLEAGATTLPDVTVTFGVARLLPWR